MAPFQNRTHHIVGGTQSHTRGGEGILTCDKMEGACQKIRIQTLKKIDVGVAGAV